MFAEVVCPIDLARQGAYGAANTELIDLYWQIGEYICGKLPAAKCGDSVVDSLAQHQALTVQAPT